MFFFAEKSLLPKALAGSQWHWSGLGPSQRDQGSLQPGSLEPGDQLGGVAAGVLPLPRRPVVQQADGSGQCCWG